MNVFVSYRRKSSGALASLLKNILPKFGITVFVDTYDMEAGSVPENLKEEILRSDALLCLLAGETFESSWVREEVSYAHSLKKLLVPVFQESYVPPSPPVESYVEALLGSSGITILDERNIYIDAAIEKLARLLNPLTVVADNRILGLSGGAYVRIEIVLNLPKVDVRKFLIFLSGIALIGVNLIRVISEHLGSVVLVLEMPETAANQVLQTLREQPSLVTEYKLLDIRNLGVVRNNRWHIISSMRGGVGTTLLSLAILRHYMLLKTPVVGVDFNTMHPQLSQMLATSDGAKYMEPRWVAFPYDKNVFVTRRTNPYLLLEGAVDFWRSLLEIKESSVRGLGFDSQPDLVVDTNLHFLNILAEDESVESIFSKIMATPHQETDIYIWVILTWPNLQDSLRELDLRIASFAQKYGSHIEVIYVLKPSVLVARDTRFDLRKQLRDEILRMEEEFNNRINAHRPESHDARLLIEMRERQINQMLESFAEYNPNFVDNGLQQIANAPVSSDISGHDFGKLAEGVFEDKEDYLELSRLLGDTRPRNLLAIPTFNANLVDYTKMLPRVPDPLSNPDLEAIQGEVTKLLLSFR